MILYANGCSHTAAAEAVIKECFANDDGKHGIDRRPHPRNLAASWCTQVAKDLDMDLVCEAEAGGSNPRILRTTRQWIENHPDKLDDVVMIIQWTTWERDEWLHNGTWYQVNASGKDWVPEELQQRYKQFVIDVDWTKSTAECHKSIWELHQELLSKKIRHLFFSGHSTFSDIQNRQDWGHYYMDPYIKDQSYYNWLTKNGGTYARPEFTHFDAKSHRLWADYVLQYIYRNQILDPIV
jgi:hypothetical protein